VREVADGEQPVEQPVTVAAPKEREPAKEQLQRAPRPKRERAPRKEEGAKAGAKEPKEMRKEKEEAARAILQKAKGEEPVVEAVPQAPEKEKEEKEPRLLFNRWDLNEVEVTDPGLKRYINLHSMIVPHSSGKLTKQQFAKGEMLIVERLINRLMQTEMNTGKKHRTMRITKEAFDIVHRKTKKNPVQVLVDAISQAGPREETVRLKYGGINVPKSVDTAPLRRVNSAIRFICEGVYSASHKNKKYVAEVLADELIAAARGDSKCYSVTKREERERIAKASR
jgi:small subunit ribosomal protein S7